MLLHCRASDTAQGDSARSNYSSSTTRTCDHDHHTYAAEVAWSSATSQSASVAHCLIHQPFVHPEALHLYLDDIACDHTSAVLLLITAQAMPQTIEVLICYVPAVTSPHMYVLTHESQQGG